MIKDDKVLTLNKGVEPVSGGQLCLLTFTKQTACSSEHDNPDLTTVHPCDHVEHIHYSVCINRRGAAFAVLVIVSIMATLYDLDIIALYHLFSQ